MTDIMDQGARSRLMSRIKGKDTKPEMVVRRFLHAQGFRYRLHDKTLPGKPDLVFPKYRTVVFVHGCYWHRHFGCRKTTTPKTRSQFWRTKFLGNVIRDRRDRTRLEAEGWRVLVIWECETLSLAALSVLADEIRAGQGRHPRHSRR